MNPIEKIKRNEYEYNHYKRIVITWEEAFKRAEKRTPNKDDLKKASSGVREAYRKYHDMKNKLSSQSPSSSNNNSKKKDDEVEIMPSFVYPSMAKDIIKIQKGFGLNFKRKFTFTKDNKNDNDKDKPKEKIIALSSPSFKNTAVPHRIEKPTEEEPQVHEPLLEEDKNSLDDNMLLDISAIVEEVNKALLVTECPVQQTESQSNPQLDEPSSSSPYNFADENENTNSDINSVEKIKRPLKPKPEDKVILKPKENAKQKINSKVKPSKTKAKKSPKLNDSSKEKKKTNSKNKKNPKTKDGQVKDKKEKETKPRAPRIKKTENAKEKQKSKKAKDKSIKELEAFNEFDHADKKARKEKLKRKRINTTNGNFVKIDVSKKVFVRGKKYISRTKLKRESIKESKEQNKKQATIDKKTINDDEENLPKDKNLLIQNQNFQYEVLLGPNFPSFNEIMNIPNLDYCSVNKEKKKIEQNEQIESESIDNENKDSLDPYSYASEEEEEAISRFNFKLNQNKIIEPYFNGQEPEEEVNEVFKKALEKFGYESFKPGQREAIYQILKGESTLSILSTGGGKSLIYQMPAYLYSKRYTHSLALCISPLISLMEDQIFGIPTFIEAACLHSNMTEAHKAKVLEKIKGKKLQVLLVSPEAVCTGLFGILKNSENAPQISFACIDEAHCVSIWSHNFRPTYLTVCQVLREKLGVKTFLGLTATATDYTAFSICDHLQVDHSKIIRGEIIPSNLNLSVSRDLIRDESLLILLRGNRFKDAESIIIYCTRRDECERISKLIRTNLREYTKYDKVLKQSERSKLSANCEAYHAGLSARKRRIIQENFMSGKIRIVVATVAFGMGIDKSDIRSVIHFNMPFSYESYVQEIGRSGRDGKPAHCHLFLDREHEKDLFELKRHIYSNSIDRPSIRKILQKVFPQCKCNNNDENGENVRCKGHEVAISKDKIVEDIDLPEENIATLLCYLEVNKERKWIIQKPSGYQKCTIISYKGPSLFKDMAQKSRALAVAIALQVQKGLFSDTDSRIEFNIIEASSVIGMDSYSFKRELRNLEWDLINKGSETKWNKSGFIVKFSELAFIFIAPGDLTENERNQVLDLLDKRGKEHEKAQLFQLHQFYKALSIVSTHNAESANDDFNVLKSDTLKNFIIEYFKQDSVLVPSDWTAPIYGKDKEEDIRCLVRQLLLSCRDVDLNGRNIAKILQGIPSPNFPPEVWGRNYAFWRKYLNVDFNFLCMIASQEILGISSSNNM